MISHKEGTKFFLICFVFVPFVANDFFTPLRL